MSITGYLRGLRGFYEYNPVIFEDFGVQSLSHDFPQRTLSYIPTTHAAPSPYGRGGALFYPLIFVPGK